MHSNFAMLSLVCFLCPALLVCFGVHIHFHLAHVASLHCNQTCHEIPGIVCLRNGSQKACSDIPHGYTDLCIHFWLASFLHALWLVIFLQNLSRNATNKYHLCFAFQKIEKGYVWFVCLSYLCCCVIKKRNERVLLSEGWKQFDIFTEIESLQIYLRSIKLKQCKNGVE